LSLSTSYGQSVNSPLSRDKQKHIMIGSSIGLATLEFTGHKSDLQRIFISSWVATTTSFGYELYQGISGKGSVETLDVVYTCAGALVSTAIVVYIPKIFKKRKHGNRCK
jgi:hypothetical protein